MPASPPAVGVEQLDIVITGIEGNVQIRMAEGEPWKTAVLGMDVDQGAELRTGPRSAVRFVILPDQTVTLDRLGTIKVLQAIRDAKKIKTDLGMKYGRTRYDIEAAGLEHESHIRAPGTQLAVRGTKVSLYDQPPFDPEAVSLTGRAAYVNVKKQMIPFGAKGRRTAISGTQAGAASHEIAKTRDNPVSLTDSDDARRLLALQDRKIAARIGSIVSTLVNFELSQAFLISHPKDPAFNVATFLAFSLSWTGQSNINLIVRTPAGEIMASAPQVVTANGALKLLNMPFARTLSGGRIDPGPFNDYQNNPPASGGNETAYWTRGTYPAGAYTVTANLTAGTAANLTLQVFQNGQMVGTPLTGSVSSSKPNARFTVPILATPAGH